MSYRLTGGRPLAHEVRRLLDQEATAAASALMHPPAAGHARRVHDARKHIKKARALMQMARRPLGRTYEHADDELRVANRALGPLADARRVLETLAAARRAGVVQLPVTEFSTVRTRLESRAMAIEAAAEGQDVRGRTIRLLASLRQEWGSADVVKLDRRAIVDEIRRTHAGARTARGRALHRPAIDTYHRWRRMVKREWHLMRLVADITGNRLRDERHQLAELDACLGELHDVDVLVGALTVTAPLSRKVMARLIRSLRAHSRDLRHRAHHVSAVLDERPRDLERRVTALWGSRSPGSDAVEHTWPHSA